MSGEIQGNAAFIEAILKTMLEQFAPTTPVRRLCNFLLSPYYGHGRLRVL